MHFQIFIPKAPDLQPELAKVGLAEFIPNSEVIREPVGPDGEGGAIFAWWTSGPASRQIGYRPDQQTWLKSQCGRYWSGVWKESPPVPSELVIGDSAGKRIRLGSGEWLVPSLDRAERELTAGPDGTHAWKMPARFHDLTLKRLYWVERFHANPKFTYTEELFLEFLDVGVAALRLNYRMTREVALACSLFSTRTVIDVFNVALGDLISMHS